MRPAKRCHLRRCRSAALAMCTRVRKARLACGSGASSFESYARVRPSPHAHRDRSPDRLCIPSRAASHRLNVKVGKNVYNHEGPRKKGPVGVGERTEEAPRGAAGAGPRTGRTSKRGRRRVRPRPAGAARNVREDRRERWRRRGPATRWCDRWCGLPSAALHATGPGRCGCAPYCDSGLRRSEHGLVGCRLAVSPQKPIPGRGWCWEYR